MALQISGQFGSQRILVGRQLQETPAAGATIIGFEAEPASSKEFADKLQ
jgi:hypothetical protein